MSKFTDSEKLKIYEGFLHKFQLYMACMNHQKCSEASDIIFYWSYSHRCGNGEYTEEEQQTAIDNQIIRMQSFIKNN